MKKSYKDINTISEAIEHLEKTGSSKAKEFNETFGKDFDEIKKAFENLKPHITNIKEELQQEAQKTKKEVEEKLMENPWMTIGIVGLLAFFIGWLIGSNRK